MKAAVQERAFTISSIGLALQEARVALFDLQQASYGEDFKRYQAACTDLGIHLRFAERMRAELEASLEAERAA